MNIAARGGKVRSEFTDNFFEDILKGDNALRISWKKLSVNSRPILLPQAATFILRKMAHFTSMAAPPFARLTVR